MSTRPASRRRYRWRPSVQKG